MKHQDNKIENDTDDSRWPRRIGMLLVAIVFPLIWVGGLVTTTDAGMAVPDWPNTYGYNLFLYPMREWFFGPWDLFVEHGHRLLGSLAGLVAIFLVFVTVRGERRRWVRDFSIVILGLVIVQGLLGGARVVMDERVLAKIHGCLGPAFFAAAVGFCVVTSSWWKKSRLNAADFRGSAAARRMRQIATVMLAISYLQLIIGAFLRHIADDASPQIYQSLVILHVVTAVLIVLGTFSQLFVSLASKIRGAGLRGSIAVLALLVLLQFGLGIGTWVVKFGWPGEIGTHVGAAAFVIAEKSFLQVNIVTAHVAIGSLILAFWTVHALRCHRVLATESEPAVATEISLAVTE